MSKGEVIYNYEINPFTMAILSKAGSEGSFSTVVLEERREYTAFQTPTKMVDYACKYYGASLRGHKLM